MKKAPKKSQKAKRPASAKFDRLALKILNLADELDEKLGTNVYTNCTYADELREVAAKIMDISTFMSN